VTLPAKTKRQAHCSDFRPGDIVEVSPGWRDGRLLSPFKGVVTTLRPGRMDYLMWVYVRQLEPVIGLYAGGWYPSQCRLIIRPPVIPALPTPPNVVLGDG
jgi:hypothetical protein